MLNQATEEWGKGDLRQASEKGWGAAAQMVKAVAANRGWDHNGHFLLRRVVDRLVQETGDSQLFTWFGVASHLHMNFYENWSSGQEVESGLHDVELFLDKLEPLLH